MNIYDFGMIFSFSFITALSGALSPGPLLTYTIMKSIQNQKYGYWLGALVITGHAILESVIIIIFLLGLTFIFNNKLVIMIISLAGCGFLIFTGIQLIKDVLKGNIKVDFLNNEKSASQTAGQFTGLDNPVIGGIVVSMSNPYWWIWWVTTGFAFMIKFNISLSNPLPLLAFFLGHEAGDLAWYVPVSILACLGRKKINKGLYYGILFICGIALAGFGIYLGIEAIK